MALGSQQIVGRDALRLKVLTATAGHPPRYAYSGHRSLYAQAGDVRLLSRAVLIGDHIGVYIGSAFPAFYMYRRTRRRCGDAARSSSFKRQFSDPRSYSASLSILVPQLCLLGDIDPAEDAGQRQNPQPPLLAELCVLQLGVR